MAVQVQGTWLRMALPGGGPQLMREDRNPHTIHTVEAAFLQNQGLRGTPQAAHVLVAGGETLFDGADAPA